MQGPTPDPCGKCNSCIGLAPEGSGTVDVVELDAASHGGVDDARELRDKAFYAPAESRYRVFIIDEAHMVTTQGFNALLKIVEEPPEHLVFIFATTEPDKVLPTIRSRTHHYPFRLIPPGAMRALLDRNCADEGVSVEPAVFPLVIRAGGGSARDTQSVMDQLLAGAGANGVTYERAVSLLGVTDVGLIDDIVDGLAAGDGTSVYGTVDRLVEAGHDPRRFAADLLARLRDLVMLRAVPEAAERGLVSAPEDELARMRAQAERIGPATLTRYAEIVHTGLVEMRGATAPRLLVELLCARMLLPAASATDAAVLQRLEGVERRLTLAPGAAPAAPAAIAPAAQPVPVQESVQQEAPQRTFARPSRPEPVAAAPVTQSPAPVAEPTPAPVAAASTAVDSTAVRQIWPELLSQVGQRSKPTLALLLNATVHAVEGDTLVLSMPTVGLARQLNQESRAEHIRATLRNLLSGEWQVRCVHGNGGTPPPAEAPRRTPPPPAEPGSRASRPGRPRRSRRRNSRRLSSRPRRGGTWRRRRTFRCRPSRLPTTNRRRRRTWRLPRPSLPRPSRRRRRSRCRRACRSRTSPSTTRRTTTSAVRLRTWSGSSCSPRTSARGGLIRRSRRRGRPRCRRRSRPRSSGGRPRWSARPRRPSRACCRTRSAR